MENSLAENKTGEAEKPTPAATVLPCATGRVVMGKACECKGSYQY